MTSIRRAAAAVRRFRRSTQVPTAPSVTPGNHVLELAVTDRLAKRTRGATPAMDFEVIA